MSWFIFLVLLSSRFVQTNSQGFQSRRLSQTNETRVSSFEELEEALREASDETEILIDSENLRLSSTLRITQNGLTLRGLQTTTTLQCPRRGGAFLIRGSNLQMENLRITGCREDSALRVEANRPEGNLTLRGITLEDNILESLFSTGAGIQIQRCEDPPCSPVSLTLEDCLLQNNQAEIGAGVFAEETEVVLRNCRFEGNEAFIRGAGLTLMGSNSTVVMENCQFLRNRVIQPLPTTRAFYGDSNGAPLETIPYWTFMFPTSGGGAAFLDTVHQIEIRNCLFRRNLGQAGGALGIMIDVFGPYRDADQSYSMEIHNSTFHSNQANYTRQFRSSAPPGSVNEDLNLGGAMYIASSSDQFTFQVTESVFSRNWAVHGGALHMVSQPQTQPLITQSQFLENQAQEAGGGLLLRNSGELNLLETNFTGNRGRLGGGIMLTNNGQMLVVGLAGLQQRQGTPCVFDGNRATSGGGMMCSGCGTAVLQDPVFFNNTATDRGGGLFALDSNAEIAIIQGRFEQNEARLGGGLAAEVTASVRISAASQSLRSFFINNTAEAGGALFMKANHQRENRLHIRQTSFLSNSAVGSELANDCGQGGGGGLCLVLDEIPNGAVADFLLKESTLEENRAEIGGGGYVQVDGISWLDGVEGRSRCPTARPTNIPCRSFRFGNVTIMNNQGRFGAGGLFINDPETLALFCPLVIPFQRQSLRQVTDLMMENGPDLDFIEDLLCTRITNNTVPNSEFGPDVATQVYSLLITDPAGPITNHTGGEAFQGSGSCPEAISCGVNGTNAGVQVTVLDAFGQRISNGVEDAQLEVVLISGAIIGEQRYLAHEGIIHINNTIGVGINTMDQVRIQSVQNRSLETVLEFSTRGCLPGENRSAFSCQPCLPNQYSFDADVGCRDCEDRAICQGMAALVPTKGFWHSTPFSPQFHECIVRSACEANDRVKRLTAYYSNLFSLDQNLQALDAYLNGEGVLPDYSDYDQCAEGYRGVLCGSCKDGYGHFPGGECVECPAGKAGSAMLAVLISLWTAIFLGVNILTTFSSTQRQIQMVICQRKEPGKVPAIELREINESPTSPCNDSLQQERIVALVKMTETLKIFINYLQVTSVALSINLNWQTIIKALLSIEALVMGVASGTYLVPLDCSFSEKASREGVPNSIKVLWLQVTFPLVLLLFFSFLTGLYLWRNRSRNQMLYFSSFKSYFTVVAIVVTFFSYIRVTSEFMRTVNCISVDDSNSDHVYSRYATQTENRIWAEDTELTCFEGDHTLTGVFGILGLVFFSLMVIVFIFTWLPYNAKRLQDPEFIARYGFLYQGYKDAWYYTFWEAIIAIRKALIAAAVVFAFPLGPNLQGVCALGVVILAIAVHFIFRPFKTFKGHPNVPPYAGSLLRWTGFPQLGDTWVLLNNSISLNALESGSLLMSIIVFYSGILFNDENTSEGGKHTMAAFTFIVNVAFIFYILYRLYSGAHVAVNLYCDQLKTITRSVSIPPGNGLFGFIRKAILIFVNRSVIENFDRGQTLRHPVEEHI